MRKPRKKNFHVQVCMWCLSPNDLAMSLFCRHLVGTCWNSVVTGVPVACKAALWPPCGHPGRQKKQWGCEATVCWCFSYLQPRQRSGGKRDMSNTWVKDLSQLSLRQTLGKKVLREPLFQIAFKSLVGFKACQSRSIQPTCVNSLLTECPVPWEDCGSNLVVLALLCPESLSCSYHWCLVPASVMIRGKLVDELPSDTELLLTNKPSEIVTFYKNCDSHAQFPAKSFFRNLSRRFWGPKLPQKLRK